MASGTVISSLNWLPNPLGHCLDYRWPEPPPHCYATTRNVRVTANGPTVVTGAVAVLDGRYHHRLRVNPRCDPITTDDEATPLIQSPVAPMTPRSGASTCEAPRWWAYAATGAIALDLSIETGMECKKGQISVRPASFITVNCCSFIRQASKLTDKLELPGVVP